MEKRLYFIGGDLLACALLSALGGWVAALLPTGWPMSVEMLAGMTLGMLAAMAALPPFMALFGAMEVMMPVMLGSMCSSMLPSMLPETRGELGLLLGSGAGIGLLAWLVTRVADGLLHGETRYE